VFRIDRTEGPREPTGERVEPEPGRTQPGRDGSVVDGVSSRVYRWRRWPSTRAGAWRSAKAVAPGCSGSSAAMQSPYLPAMDLTPYSYNRTMAEYFHSCKSEWVTHTHSARTCHSQLYIAGPSLFRLHRRRLLHRRSVKTRKRYWRRVSAVRIYRIHSPEIWVN